MVHHTVGRMPAELVRPDEQDVPADPQHRDGADDRQCGKQFGHPRHQAAADALREPGRPLCKAEPDVVHLHDDGDHAVHRRGDDQGDDDEDDQPRPERLVGNLIECDHHDLGGQDEVGPDRAGRHLAFGVLARDGDRSGVPAVPGSQPSTFSAPS